MRAKNIRLWIPNASNWQQNAEILISEDRFHYMAHVLRVRVNEPVCIFHETQGEWIGSVVSLDKKTLVLRLERCIREPHPLTILQVGIPMVKPSTFEDLLDKGTQLGVTDFFPVHSLHSGCREYNPERIGKILIEATEQSGRIQRPQVHPALALPEFVACYASHICVFLEPRFRTYASHAPMPQHPIACIGPEGGFADQEVELFRKKDVHIVNINAAILRVETALPAALGFILGCQL